MNDDPTQSRDATTGESRDEAAGSAGSTANADALDDTQPLDVQHFAPTPEPAPGRPLGLGVPHRNPAAGSLVRAGAVRGRVRGRRLRDGHLRPGRPGCVPVEPPGRAGRAPDRAVDPPGSGSGTAPGWGRLRHGPRRVAARRGPRVRRHGADPGPDRRPGPAGRDIRHQPGTGQQASGTAAGHHRRVLRGHRRRGEGRPGRGQDHGRRASPRIRSGASRPRASAPGSSTTPSGWILTNHHVVTGADKLIVELKDGRQFAGTVYGIDTLTDLAIVKVDATGLPTAPIGRSDGLKIGQLVVAIGSPLGTYSFSVTSGIVSGKGRDIQVDNGDADHQPDPDRCGHQPRQLGWSARRRLGRRGRREHRGRHGLERHRLRDPDRHRPADHGAGAQAARRSRARGSGSGSSPSTCRSRRT